jgi:hypothetical protein
MRFENQTFTDDVTLDHNRFVKCIFRGCRVFFHGGPYELVDTRMENVQFAFGDAANNTLVLLKVIKGLSPKLSEDLIDNAGNATPPPSGKRH